MQISRHKKMKCFLLYAAVAFCMLILTGCKMPAPETELPKIVSVPSAFPLNPTPSPAPSLPTNSLLPSALYFLRPDANQVAQVWRLAQDGKTLSQLTSTTEPVREYDVASNGRLAIISGGSLIVLAVGNSLTETWIQQPDASPDQIPSTPRWAPGGSQLAYSSQGVWVGRSPNTMHLVAANPPDSRIRPYAWSPDGRWLLVTIDGQERSELAVLDPASGKIHILKTADGATACCQAAWAPQSQGLVVANPYSNTGIADLQSPQGTGGLWWVTINETNFEDIPVQALLPPQAVDGTYNFVGWPHFSQDGMLQYAFANFPTLPEQRFPMALYQASLATPDLRQLMRAETFPLDQVLWSSDGRSAALVLPMAGAAWKNGGPVVFVPADQTPATPLVGLGSNLKWGP